MMKNDTDTAHPNILARSILTRNSDSPDHGFTELGIC
jgi:hypothetical protein